MAKRVPIGPCAFITPFNFPLNLVAHKVAPAIAAGCPFVLKPAAKTPVGALIIGAVLAETDLPKGAFSILPCSNDDAGLLVERSEEHTSELQSLMRISYAVFCLKKKKIQTKSTIMPPQRRTKQPSTPATLAHE